MNQWLRFSNGEINAVKVEAVISKEVTPNGNQLIHITINDKEVYQFWYNPNKSRNKEPPKHTGGRKPYIIVMIEQVEKLRTEINNVEELVGFIVCLSNNIEWNTGKLVHKRSKKPLKYTDLQKMFSGGKRKLDRIIKDLREHNLLSNTAEGYFISHDFIKKGAKREAVRNGL